MTYFKINQELVAQLEASQQRLHDMTPNFHVAKATLDILATQLRKFKSTKFNDVISPVLREWLQPEKLELAKKLRQLETAEQLRESCILIGEWRRKLSQRRQKLEEGGSESLLLKDRLRAILAQHDTDVTQDQDVRRQLAEGCRLAERLAGKLRPEDLEEKYGEAHQTLVPRLGAEGVEQQEQVPQHSAGEDHMTPSGSCEPSDSWQPPCSSALLACKVCASPDAAPESSEPQDILKPQEEEEPVAPRELEEWENISDSAEDALDEKYLVFSTCQDLAVSPEPPYSPAAPANQSPCADEEAPEPESPRTWCIIRDNAKKLTQLRDQLGKGSYAAFSLRQSLQHLFSQDKPAYAAFYGQSRREELLEGCKLADHLVLQLHAANYGNETDEEEKGPLYQMDDQGSFLIHAQVQELTKLWKKLVEGRNTAFILQKNLRDLLSQDDFAACQGQSHHEKLMAWRELAERLARDLCPEHHCDGDDEEETESLDSSVELCEVEVNELLSDSAEEHSVLTSGHPDAPYQQQHRISLVIPDEPEVICTPDGSKPEDTLKPQEEEATVAPRIRIAHLAEIPQLEMELDEKEAPVKSQYGKDSPGGPQALPVSCASDILRTPTSRSQAAMKGFNSLNQVQAEMSTHLTESLYLWRDVIVFLCVRIQALLTSLDPVRCHKLRGQKQQAPTQAACPHGLSSGALSPNVSDLPKDPRVPGNHRVGTRPGQRLDCGAGRAALGLFSPPWRFVDHTDAGKQGQLSPEPNLDASLEMEKPPKVEADALEVLDDATCGTRAHGLPGAATVLKQTMLKRKPRFCQWKMACRFPGLQA